MESAATATAIKNEDTDVAESNSQDNSYDGKSNEKRNENFQEKSVHESKKRKRENKLKTTDDDGPVPKKMSANDVEKEDLQTNNDGVKIKTRKVKLEGDNEERNSTEASKRKDFQMSDVKIKTKEKDNEETTNTKIKKNRRKKNDKVPSGGKSELFKKKRKDSKLGKVQKRGKRGTPDGVDSMMSLDAERLRTYGINAKKFKNKLKYGKKKF